jgi:hypothetical protein
MLLCDTRQGHFGPFTWYPEVLFKNPSVWSLFSFKIDFQSLKCSLKGILVIWLAKITSEY